MADESTDDLGVELSELSPSQRLTMLVLGGTSIMSLIIAGVVLTLTSPQSSRPLRPAEWGQVKALSELGSEVRNVVHLDGNSLIWNGRQITELKLREYLGITTKMSPQPVLVLSYGAQTKPARIKATRSVIEDILQCTPSNCREVTPSPAD